MSRWRATLLAALHHHNKYENRRRHGQRTAHGALSILKFFLLGRQKKSKITT
jgi:hypothetical protein